MRIRDQPPGAIDQEASMGGYRHNGALPRAMLFMALASAGARAVAPPAPFEAPLSCVSEFSLTATSTASFPLIPVGVDSCQDAENATDWVRCASRPTLLDAQWCELTAGVVSSVCWETYECTLTILKACLTGQWNGGRCEHLTPPIGPLTIERDLGPRVSWEVLGDRPYEKILLHRETLGLAYVFVSETTEDLPRGTLTFSEPTASTGHTYSYEVSSGRKDLAPYQGWLYSPARASGPIRIPLLRVLPPLALASPEPPVPPPALASAIPPVPPPMPDTSPSLAAGLAAAGIGPTFPTSAALAAPPPAFQAPQSCTSEFWVTATAGVSFGRIPEMVAACTLAETPADWLDCVLDEAREERTLCIENAAGPDLPCWRKYACHSAVLRACLTGQWGDETCDQLMAQPDPVTIDTAGGPRVAWQLAANRPHDKLVVRRMELPNAFALLPTAMTTSYVPAGALSYTDTTALPGRFYGYNVATMRKDLPPYLGWLYSPSGGSPVVQMPTPPAPPVALLPLPPLPWLPPLPTVVPPLLPGLGGTATAISVAAP